jgi:hypothetical protein
MKKSRAIRMTQAEYEEHQKNVGVPVEYRKQFEEHNKSNDPPKPKEPKMSKTEMEYEDRYLFGIKHKFQPFTFHMENSLKYRPDFYLPDEHTFIEIKGSYHLPSHGRSVLAFCQCKVEFPEFKWVMAEKQKDGGWKIS